jgi:hypothetical protein
MYTDAERTEMRDLILSLSLEATDHDRRVRVREVFYEALVATPDGGGMPWKRFTDLFDLVLAEVGEEVQLKAKRRYFEEAERAGGGASASAVEDSSTATEEGGAETSSSSQSPSNKGSSDTVEEQGDAEGECRPQWKYPEEPQLWALIDVMVQSKTIVKRADGKLGSKGSFQ